MKKYVYTNILTLCALALVLTFTGCGDMDDSYKEYRGDGPIVYLGKVDESSLSLQPGRDRIKINLPAQSDPRAKYVKITWANGTGEKDVPVTPGQPTEFILDKMREALYEFVLYHFNDDGLKSVNTTATGEVYGSIYESYLTNRNIESTDIDLDNRTVTINFPALGDSSIVATQIKWEKDGKTHSKIYENTKNNKLTIEDFDGTTFDYRCCYLPEPNAIDTFYSGYEVYHHIPKKYELDRTGWLISTSYPPNIENAGKPTENGRADQLIDNDNATYLSLAKPGKLGIAANAECYFVIDMGRPVIFDYFKLNHREHPSITLRVQQVSFYGSNDGTTFSLIKSAIPINYETGDIYLNQGDLPVSRYRYIKMTYDSWDKTASNTMQLSDFKLGVTK